MYYTKCFCSENRATSLWLVFQRHVPSTTPLSIYSLRRHVVQTPQPDVLSKFLLHESYALKWPETKKKQNYSWLKSTHTKSILTFSSSVLIALRRILAISCSASAAFWLKSIASSSATRLFSARRSALSSERLCVQQHVQLEIIIII